jgi:hypothetical protein
VCSIPHLHVSDIFELLNRYVVTMVHARRPLTHPRSMCRKNRYKQTTAASHNTAVTMVGLLPDPKRRLHNTFSVSNAIPVRRNAMRYTAIPTTLNLPV